MPPPEAHSGNLFGQREKEWQIGSRAPSRRVGVSLSYENGDQEGRRGELLCRLTGDEKAFEELSRLGLIFATLPEYGPHSFIVREKKD